MTTPAHLSLDLTQRIALVQAHVEALERARDEFVDLTDMQALRLLRAEVTRYIARKHASGELPRDPLGFIAGHLHRLRVQVGESESLYREFIRLEDHLLSPGPRSLTADDLAESMARIRTAEARLDQRLSPAARAPSVALDVAPADGPASPSPALQPAPAAPQSLALVPPWLAPKLPSPELLELAEGRGPLRDAIQRHLSTVKRQCRALLEQHDVQRASVELLARAASKGDFRKARAGLQSLTQVFADIDYDAVERMARRCEDWLHTVQAMLERHRATVQSWRHKRFPFQPRRARRELNDALERLDAFRQELREFRENLGEASSTDFDRDARRLIESLSDSAETLRIQLDELGRRSISRARLQLAGVGAAALVVACAAWWIIPGLSAGSAPVSGSDPAARFGTQPDPFIPPAQPSASSKTGPVPAPAHDAILPADALEPPPLLAAPPAPTASEPTPAAAPLTVRAPRATGSLEVVGKRPARFRVLAGTDVLAEGTSGSLVRNLPAQPVAIEFFPIDPVPAGPLRLNVTIDPATPARVEHTLPFSTFDEWVGQRFTNALGQTMEPVSSGVWLARDLVSAAQFQAVTGQTPAGNREATAPVRYVTLSEARAFADRFSEAERGAGRLADAMAYAVPTEMEFATFILDELERLPRSVELAQRPLRSLLHLPEGIEGEWLDTKHDSSGDEVVLGAFPELEEARIIPDFRTHTGFRLALVDLNRRRKPARLRPFLGVSIKVTGEGGEVVWVDPRSPAERAGLEGGDVLVEAAGRPVVNEDGFRMLLRTVAPGETLPLRVRKRGEPETGELLITVQ